MANTSVRLDEQKLMNQVAMDVLIVTRPLYRIRKWLGIKLIILASKLLGVGRIGFEYEEIKHEAETDVSR